MSRRSGKRAQRMTHSVKKLKRRAGDTSVKARKAKRKPPSHPGHKAIGKHQAKMKELANPAVVEATKERAVQYAADGKKSRLDLIARRRGIVLGAGSLQGGAAAMDDGSAAAAEPERELDLEADADAMNAAKRALALAPAEQRTFHKELSTVLKAADILLEVIDARDPMGCRCLPLEDAVLAKCRTKKIVLILNKVDLVPPDVTQRWLKYLRQYFPTLPFKASTQNQRELGRGAQSASVGKLSSYGSEAYGGEALLQLLKNYSRSINMKTAITVGIVGYPNVGKSSVINSLKRARAVHVGAAPGVTTHAQLVAIDSKVKLMDCPGIIFARAQTEEERAEVMLRNCVRVEKLDDPAVPVEAILRKVPAEQLRRKYAVGAYEGALEFLTLVAAKQGKLRKGGAPDHEAAARAVLHDWNAGVIKYHTEPPAPTGGVEIVDQYGDGFDWQAAARVMDANEAEAAAEAAAAGAEAAAEAEASRRAQKKAERAASVGARGGGGGGGAAGGDADDAMGEGGEAAAQGRLLSGWKQAHEDRSGRKPKKPKLVSKRNLIAAAADDDRFNFQHNRGMRKAQKQVKKKERKNKMAQAMLMQM